MKFSVLTTVYKKETPSNLRKSLLSSYQQTLKPTEIILVCDGELTEELEIEIQKLQREIPILKVFHLPENLGSGPASLFGVNQCQTEFIARMDSDDYSLETRFEKQAVAFEKKSQPHHGWFQYPREKYRVYRLKESTRNYSRNSSIFENEKSL